MVDFRNNVKNQDIDQYHNAVLDNLSEFVVRWLPDGIRTYVNQSYCNYYNLTREQALGTSFFPHIAEQDLKIVKQRIALLSSENPSSSDIHRVYRPDGTIGWQEWTDTAIFDESGSLVEYQSVGRDITARKLVEEELTNYREHLEQLVENRTRELNKAYHELESFSYSVSHDLRGPLRSISGFSSELLEEYSDKLDNTAKSYLEHIVISVRRMSETIDALLALSQISKKELNKASVDLSHIVKNISARLKTQHPQRNAKFDIEQDVKAEADLQLLQIVFENLIGNAWKYTMYKTETTISFTTEHIDNHHVFCIEDNGAGFDMKNVNQLFHAFRRLHSYSEFPGTGIGLATVYRIIERHGGKIWAEGKLNQGAKFCFTLD